jgi:hypothetical protein
LIFSALLVYNYDVIDVEEYKYAILDYAIGLVRDWHEFIALEVVREISLL